MTMTAILVAFFLAAGVGEPPVARITGPTSSAPGDLVVLDATQSSGALSYAWVLVNSSKTFLPVDAGQRIVFASATEGDYVFVLVVAGAVDGRAMVSIVQHRVQITAPKPPNPPGPEPTPPPSPKPSFPDDRWGLAQIVYDAAMAVSRPTGQRAREAQSMAKAFRAVAAQVVAVPMTVEQIRDAYSKGLADALGPAFTAWRSWGIPFGRRLGELADTELTDTAKWARALEDVALGLEAVQ